MDDTPAIVERYYELIAAGDPERLAMLYTADGEVIRYDGVASGKAEIEQYYRDYLAARTGLALRQIDNVRNNGDVLLWDALLDSDRGVLQTIDVVVLDDEGKIRNHIPGFRGYWGR
jgi:ketosteroid isomerase-like protein